MIEVSFELKLDSFLVNSVGGGGEMAGKSPNRAVKFICENIASARKLTEHAPSADFEFLGAAGKKEAKAEAVQGFDDILYAYLMTHTTVDVSSITLCSEASGYATMPKGQNTGEIGRMTLTRLPEQSRVDIELVLKNDEFEAVWTLTTERNVRLATIKLDCFELKQETPPASGKTKIVAGILSSSLQLLPPSGD